MKKVGLYVGLVCLAICAMVGCNKIQESYTELESNSDAIISESEEDNSTESSEEVDTDANFHICLASYAGEVEVLAEIPLLDIVSEDLMDLFVDEDGNLYGASDYSVPDADFVEDKIYFMIMSYQGTGHMPMSGAVYELNKTEGSCNKIFMTTTATKFQIVVQDAAILSCR